MRSRQRLISTLCALLAFSVVAGANGTADAKCESTFINPIADVCWQCIFPMKVGGVTLKHYADVPDSPETNKSAVCKCGIYFGVTSSFWQPAAIIETVKDPYCFPTLGISLSNPKEGFLGGSHKEPQAGAGAQGDSSGHTFQQAHWLKFNVWTILDLFYDIPCLETDGFDLAYMTEIDPLWNNGILAFLLNPEAILFANPAAQLSCVADSIAANTSVPIDQLFWCMGSWGSAYPLSGEVSNQSYVEANAAIAGRFTYKMARELALWDTGTSYCGPVIMPIWQKSHYRMHIVKPVRDKTCHPIGRSGLMWSQLKNPPYKASGNASDNFSWMLFKKTLCCLYYEYI